MYYVVYHGLNSRAKFVNSYKNHSRTFRQHVKYNSKRVKDFSSVSRVVRGWLRGQLEAVTGQLGNKTSRNSTTEYE